MNHVILIFFEPAAGVVEVILSIPFPIFIYLEFDNPYSTNSRFSHFLFYHNNTA